MNYYFAVIAISFYIVWMDITQRKIPNFAIVLLLITGVCYLVTCESLASVGGGVLYPLVVFIIGFILSMCRVIGMGDIKLFSLTLLLSPAIYGVDMTFLVTFIGGIWGILWHFLLCRIPFIRRVDRVQKGIPYGIPITIVLCLFTFIK